MSLESIREAIPYFPLHPRPVSRPDDPSYLHVMSFSEDHLLYGSVEYREDDAQRAMQLSKADARLKFSQRELLPDREHGRHLVIAMDEQYTMYMNYGSLRHREQIEGFKSKHDIDIETDAG